jgi:hypothetical protein
MPFHLVPNPEVKARFVCHSCNQGWMSDLERSVRPFFGALIKDISFDLTPRMMEILSMWSVKTAMVFEVTGEKLRHKCYAFRDRTDLSRGFNMPTSTHIWIGRFIGSGLAYYCEDIETQLPSIGKYHHGSLFTFVVGHVILQVLTLRPGADGDESRMFKLRSELGPWRPGYSSEGGQ